MNVELTEERNFTLRAGTTVIRGLFAAGEWHGLKAYEDTKGRIVILDGDVVVKAHPSLLSLSHHGEVEPGFIPFPASKLTLGNWEVEVPAFQIEQYMTAVDADGKVIRCTTGKPGNNISYRNWVKKIDAAGYQLQRGTQTLAVMLDICKQPENWTSGIVGEGRIVGGIHKGKVPSPQTNDYESSDPEERRWHVLSNGFRIYDFVGRLWEYFFDDIHGDENGLVKGTIPADSPYLALAPYPSETKGMGYIPKGPLKWSGYALLRGGCFASVDLAGVFSLVYGFPEYEHGGVGVRCTIPASGPESRVTGIAA